MTDGKALKSDADRLLQEKNLDVSRALYEKLLSLPGYCTEANYGLAVVALQSNHLDEAQRYLNACLKANPRATNAYFLLGRIAEREGNIGVAQAMYQEALRFRPDFAEAKARMLGLGGENHSKQASLEARQQGEHDRDGVQPESSVSVDPQSQAATVSSIQQRQVNPTHTYEQPSISWDLRLRPLSTAGSTDELAVRMTGAAFVGSIVQGDIISIPRKLPASGKLDAVYNLSTACTVKSHRDASDYPSSANDDGASCSGEVFALQERSESVRLAGRSVSFIRNRVLAFRIPRTLSGPQSQTKFLQVELMGMDFTSTINNGDTIEFKYNGDDEIARPRAIFNKTTGASVAAVRDARAIGRKRQLSGALIFVIFLALVTLPILALILGRLGDGLRRVNPQPAPSIQLGNWCPQGQKQIVVNGQTACVKQ